MGSREVLSGFWKSSERVPGQVSGTGDQGVGQRGMPATVGTRHHCGGEGRDPVLHPDGRVMGTRAGQGQELQGGQGAVALGCAWGCGAGPGLKVEGTAVADSGMWEVKKEGSAVPQYFGPRVNSKDKTPFYRRGKNCGQSRFGVRVKSGTQWILMSFRRFLDTRVEVLVRQATPALWGELWLKI